MGLLEKPVRVAAWSSVNRQGVNVGEIFPFGLPALVLNCSATWLTAQH